MIKTNYHTHTSYCDGKNSAEEMVLSAIEKGFSVLGFSGHSTLVDVDWTMNEADTEEYQREIERLKAKYADKIEILCGIEQDRFSLRSAYKYDFIIGSVHSLETEDGYLPLDDSPDILIDGINRYFDGDPLKLCKAYYDEVALMADKTDCDIAGHLDLITKFDETHHIFDEANPAYLKYATAAVDILAKKQVLFEVNTGAMARGLRTSPYPNRELLKYLRQKGCDVILSSDCHSRDHLDYGFDTSLKLIKACGFDRIAYLSGGKIKYQVI